MGAALDKVLGEALEDISRRNLRRRLREVTTPQGPQVVVEGCAFSNFSSNDYLGLAAHPALKEAALAEWDRGGFGTGASRLVCGTLSAHEELEAALAAFKRTEAALGFSSGYAAALGTIPALCGSSDVVILDKLAHACLVDAARLSGAVLRVFPHNNLEKLESHLAWARQRHPEARCLVVVESIYSMDGDAAPLREVVALAERFEAWIFLDEAHGVGVLGEGGRGLAEEEGVADRIDVQMGTLGKALGSHGAYIAGSALLRDYLVNRARSFIYSTAPPAPVAAAARAALGIVQGREGEELRKRLSANMVRLASVLGAAPPRAAILPWIIGEETAALSLSGKLSASGALVPAIRYPTVAKGTARLRFTGSALHSEKDFEVLESALERIRASSQ